MMKMHLSVSTKTMLFVLFLIASFHAPQIWAQCATGVDTGGACIPPDAPGMPGYQGDANQPRPAQSRAVWADRWGAIASDGATGDAGTVEHQPSKKKAIAAALAICSLHGAKNCEIALVFHNQCAAAALGGETLGSAGAPTLIEAKQNALNKCGNSNVCKIVYGACSYAERIQ